MKPNDIVYGLITWANQESYNNARIPFPPPPDFKRPKENTAVEVLENILTRVIFAGDEKYDTVFINSQCPPHVNSAMRADLAIKYITHAHRLQIACFIEAKRTRESQRYSTMAVEDEALDYCGEFFSDRSNTCDFVYAATLVGVHIRLWIVYNDDRKLESLWGSPNRGSNNDYKDLGDNASAELIMSAFRNILESAPKPWIGRSSSSAPPTSTTGAFQLARIEPNAANLPGPQFPNITRGSSTGSSALVPIHPEVSVGPVLQASKGTPTTSENCAPFPPRGYARVMTFLPSTVADRYIWMLSNNVTGNGPPSDWIVEDGYFVNSKQKLYADPTTKRLPQEAKLG
ncbi:hypothetical protein BDV25DRAFT_170044 [Aspergillus avenaceus]|uniref:Uncharacterized protein n=1 Tax=Aspergillus avenaceus TaxID=36643 RepID=A0A5N6TID4_ASPAV|nr:hypothetical protein BDV25DRAFT_170044 [Aspergillus avenaceus]